MNSENDFQTAPESSCCGGVPRHFSSVADALDTAKRDAAKVAGEAAPKIKQGLRDAAHGVAYTAAFGACFVTAFAREIAPTSLMEGIKRGTRAGCDAARRAKEGLKKTVDGPGDFSQGGSQPA